MNSSAYKALVEEKKAWYKNLKPCYCPILKETIYFNSKGFYHLTYNGFGNRRSQVEIVSRLSKIHLVPHILKAAKKIAEYRKQQSNKYWELKELVDGLIISVILRKSNHGKIFFHSTWVE